MHRWRLSQLLQKGSERTRDSLLGDLAMSARFLVISAKGRLFGHFFSVAHAAHALLQGLIKLVDMVIGMLIWVCFSIEGKIFNDCLILQAFHRCWRKI